MDTYGVTYGLCILMDLSNVDISFNNLIFFEIFDGSLFQIERDYLVNQNIWILYDITVLKTVSFIY